LKSKGLKKLIPLATLTWQRAACLKKTAQKPFNKLINKKKYKNTFSIKRKKNKS
jgi:hypothetical protein